MNDFAERSMTTVQWLVVLVVACIPLINIVMLILWSMEKIEESDKPDRVIFSRTLLTFSLAVVLPTVLCFSLWVVLTAEHHQDVAQLAEQEEQPYVMPKITGRQSRKSKQERLQPYLDAQQKRSEHHVKTKLIQSINPNAKQTYMQAQVLFIQSTLHSQCSVAASREMIQRTGMECLNAKLSDNFSNVTLTYRIHNKDLVTNLSENEQAEQLIRTTFCKEETAAKMLQDLDFIEMIYLSDTDRKIVTVKVTDC